MRIELTPSAWKAEVLPLNYIRIKWSGRRDSNSRPSPWQGDALPLSHFRIFIGRGRWIRTIESSANGFTVRPLWPLGNPSILLNWSWWRELTSAARLPFCASPFGRLEPLAIQRFTEPFHNARALSGSIPTTCSNDVSVRTDRTD